MTFDAIWQQLCKKKPSLCKDDNTVEFKSANLKTLLRQVYDQGAKSVPKSEPIGNSNGQVFDDLFGSFFKKN